MCKAGTSIGMKRVIATIYLLSIISLCLSGCDLLPKKRTFVAILSDFGVKVDNEPRAVIRFDDFNFSNGFEKIEYPDYPIVGGDLLKIKYTGEIVSDHFDYPGVLRINNGKVKSYSFEKTIVALIDNISVENFKSEYILKTDFVVLDREGRISRLNEYEGTSFYISFDKREVPKEYSEIDNKTIPIMGIYAYNPRP